MLKRLYEENRSLIGAVVRRYAGACERDPAISPEDLMQAGFIGLAHAHLTYDPNGRKTWCSWAWWYIENAVRDALGLRKRSGNANIGAVSLDTPLTDEADTSRLDMLCDSSLPDMDDRLLHDEMKRTVWAAVDDLPQLQRDIMTLYKLKGRSGPETAKELDLTPERVRSECTNAMRALRRNRRLLALREDETRYWAHKSAGAFQRDRTSTVEAAVLWRDDFNRRNGITPEE